MRRHHDHIERNRDEIPGQVREGSRGTEALSGALDTPAFGRTGGGAQTAPALRSPLALQRLPEGADPIGEGTAAAPAERAEIAAPAESSRPAGGLIVEDGAEGGGAGRMSRSQFLAELREAVTASAGEAMKGSRWSTENCPWIERWFGYYANQSASHVEAAVMKYVPGGAISDARGYIPRVSDRVHRAVGLWIRTGRVTGVPAEIVSGMQDDVGDPKGGGEKILGKAIGSDLQERMDPASVRTQLGPGEALGGGLGARFGSAFGHDFGDVRVHTDAGAAQLSSRLGARAFAVGNHIAFGRGEFRPGTPAGDGLIAHELAHVVQQRGAAESSADRGGGSAGEGALERDADRATVGAVSSLHGGSTRGVGMGAGPALSSGLSLQRCSFQERAPVEYLTDAQSKAVWINDVMKNPKTFATVEIMKVFKAAASTAEVVEIEEHVDMKKLVEMMEDDEWDLIYLGSLVPVPASVAPAVNEARAQYIADKMEDFGPARAEVITHFIISTIPTNDDVEAVLKILAGRKKLSKTIGAMKSVQEAITSRGIDLKKYADRSWEAWDIGRGLGHGIGSIFSSGEAAQMGRSMQYMGVREDLPEGYVKVLDEVDKQEFAAMMDKAANPLNAVDYVLLNIPSAVYGTVSSTVEGISDLASGDVEEGSAELVPALLLLVSLLGVKVMKGGKGAPGKAPAGAMTELSGPEGAGQFTIKGFSGPIPKDVARLQSLMALNEEAQITSGLLIERLGKEKVALAAQYVRANREAMLWVQKEGLPAIEELVKAEGNVATAKAAMKSAPKLLTATASGRTRVVRSTSEALEIAAKEGWEFDAMNPGPLSASEAGTFAGGKYSRGITQPAQKLYKGGDANNPGGSFSNFEPPEGAAQVRIDNAVKPQWLDKQGTLTGTSPINALIEIEYPAGTEFYYGPVSSQGGVYVGGQSMMQIYVRNSRSIGTFNVIRKF